MSKLPIFTETADGKLVRMTPSQPKTEDSLQELIAKFPEVIAGADETLLLIRREQPVPDMIDGNSRWSLDHVFVTRSAVPVLVEVKRAVDTRLRREVIGQILDYAAHASAYWSKGALAEAFNATMLESGENPDDRLLQFLEKESSEDFWAQVDANLSAGRMRLVIAADVIPKELARVVEFLNEQMDATVLAVELTYYEASDGRRTLAPRIIGETARANVAKSNSRTKLDPITMDEWIDKHIAPKGPKVLSGAQTHLKIVEELQGQPVVASTQGSITTGFRAEDGKMVWPVVLNTNGLINIYFAWVSSRPRLVDENVRRAFLNRFHEAVRGLSTQNIAGYPSFPAERLNDARVADAYKTILSEFVEAAKRA